MQISSVSVVYKNFRCRVIGNQNMSSAGLQKSGQKGIYNAEIRTPKNCVCKNQDMGRMDKEGMCLVATEISGCFSGFLFKRNVHCRARFKSGVQTDPFNRKVIVGFVVQDFQSLFNAVVVYPFVKIKTKTLVDTG